MTQGTNLTTSILSVFIISLILIACEDNPEVVVDDDLIGTWAENGHERQVQFNQDGAFRYYDTSGTDPLKKGSGNYEANGKDLTLHLKDGEFKWASSTNKAPISFSFEYSLEADTLSITFILFEETIETSYTRIE